MGAGQNYRTQLSFDNSNTDLFILFLFFLGMSYGLRFLSLLIFKMFNDKAGNVIRHLRCSTIKLEKYNKITLVQFIDGFKALWRE